MGGDEPAQMVNVNQMQDQYQAPEMIIEEEVEEQVIAPEENIMEDVPQETNQSGKNNEEEWMSDYEGTLNIDLYQTRDNVVIKSTIAGVRSEDLDITIANDMVTIKGERKKQETISPEDYFYQECYWGGFSRSVILPVDIDSETVEADLKDGILTIVLPKAAKAKTKKIRVKS